MAKVSVEFKIAGEKKINRLLRQLPARVQKKVIRQGLRKGMKIVQAQLRKNLPRGGGSGATRDEMGRFLARGGGTAQNALLVRAWSKRMRGTIALEVRFDTEKIKAASPKSQAYPDGFFYPAVIEYGSVKLNRPALAPAKQAYDQAGPAARDAALVVIASGVRREIQALKG